MQEGPDPPVIETPLWELVNAIYEATDCEGEAFAVLETMLAEGRISVLSRAPSCAA